MASTTRVFVSYSWDDERHKTWVARLAAALRRDGVETRLDRWHSELGDPLPAFMEREIRDNDYVVIVCTPEYRRKSDAGTGGVGFEGAIMTGEIAERGNHRKYIPVLARGAWSDAAPSWLRGKRYADLSTAERYAAGYAELLRTLQGRKSEAPPIGAIGVIRASGDDVQSGGRSTRGADEGSGSKGNFEGRAAGGGWHGSKAVAAYAIAAVLIAGLTLLYGEGVLRRTESAGEVVKMVDGGEADTVTAPEATQRATGIVFRDCTGCPAMVVVPNGSFTMGAPVHELGSYANERPLHQVTLAEKFAVGVYEVTRGEYRGFVEESGYVLEPGCWIEEPTSRGWRLSTGHGWRNVGFDQTDQHPVSCVSWDDAQAYVRWLSGKAEGEYRLLTESEWEYVARGGTSTARFWGDGDAADERDQCRYANGADMSTGFGWRADCSDRYAYTAPVGSYEGNAFGLHDVLGNVWEWTEDCWRPGYVGGPNDGSAWEGSGCERRVLRGGSRYVGPAGLRSAHRFKYDPVTRNQNTGFRVARRLPGKAGDDTR